jgi:hypothetical protein
LHAHEFETFVWVEQRQAVADPVADISAQTVTRRVHPGVWWTADRNVEAWAHVIADSERVRPGGRLHAVRGLASQLGINPAPWFTRLMIEGQWGDRVDVDADRVGRGAVWTVDARWRADLPAPGRGRAAGEPARPWGLEVQQRWQQGTVAAPAGGRALTDTTAQMLAVLHVSERDSLRVIGQMSRTQREADVAAGLLASTRQTTVASIVAQHRVGVGRSLAAGWIRERQRARSEASLPLDGGREEVFLKWSFGW